MYLAYLFSYFPEQAYKSDKCTQKEFNADGYNRSVVEEARDQGADECHGHLQGPEKGGCCTTVFSKWLQGQFCGDRKQDAYDKKIKE